MPAIRGQAKMRLNTPDSKVSFRAAVAAAAPGSLRLEAFSPFGQTGFLFVTDGTTFQACSFDEGLCYTGEADPRNLARFMHLNLDPQSVVSLLLGSAPDFCGPDASMESFVRGDGWTLKLTDPQGTRVEEVRFSRDTLRVVGFSLIDEVAGTQIEVKTEDFRQEGPRPFPFRTEVRNGTDGSTVQFRFTEIEFPETLEPELFRFSPPEGVVVEWLY